MLILFGGPCVHEAPSSQLQGEELLLHLVNCNHKPRVLIDSGALLVSLSNREVAELWLEHSDPSIVGAVSTEHYCLIIYMVLMP